MHDIVKYYDRGGFFLCSVCTGNYEIDSGCVGLIGLGTDKDLAKKDLLGKVKQRIDALNELRLEEKV